MANSALGATNAMGGASCGGGGNNAPDATYRWTAPAAAKYSIDTFGSAFDTLLYVRNGNCTGAQLACNDDFGGFQSQITLKLAAAQTVVIVVDGSRTGMIGDTRAVRPIIEFLQRDLDPATRGTAIFALGEIGAPEAADTLSRIARSDSDATVRRLAGEAARKVHVHPAVTDTEVKATPEIFPRPKAAQPPPQK